MKWVPLISLCLPLALLVRGRHRALVFWIAFSSMVDIFNSLTFISFSATKISGLVVAPYVLWHARDIWRTRPGKWLASVVLLLITMGVLYGYISPWPDGSGERSWRYLSQGRSVLSFGTIMCELMAGLYVGIRLSKRQGLRYLIAGLLAGAVFASVGMVLERVMAVDFYYLFTHWDPRELSSRPRGFNYEPRGAGYSATVGLLLLLSPLERLRLKWRAVLIACVYVGFHFAASVSAVFMLVAGVGVLGLYHRRARLTAKPFVMGVALIATLATLLTLYLPSYHPRGGRTQNAWQYSTSSKWDEYMRNQRWGSHFEVFDSAAYLYFKANPRHLIFGTGPGLISLPMSPPNLRLDSLPHIGLFLLISNFGIVGLCLWLTMFEVMVRSLWVRREYTELALVLFLVPLYLLQAKVFYIFAISVGMGSALRGKGR